MLPKLINVFVCAAFMSSVAFAGVECQKPVVMCSAVPKECDCLWTGSSCTSTNAVNCCPVQYGGVEHCENSPTNACEQGGCPSYCSTLPQDKCIGGHQHPNPDAPVVDD